MQTILSVSRVAVIAGCILFEIVSTAFCAEKHTREFFVSPAGSNNNPGTIEKPFLTAEKAKETIHRIMKNGDMTTDTIIINFRGGDYVFSETLELTLEDSGKPSAPVVWKAFQGEKVRFLGGRVISGFKSVDDINIMNRLSKQAQKNVLMTNLRSQGIHDFGKLSSRGFDRPTIPAHG